MTVLIRRPLFDQIEDQPTRESIQWLYDYVTAEGILQSNFKHFALEFRKAETEVKIPHGLGFAPIDIIQTYNTGAGAITFVYEKFDTTNLVLTTSGACVIRFFAGRYQVL